MALRLPTYTVDDLDRFLDDGNRYELLDGMLLVTPAPLPVHQIVASRLQAPLSAAVMTPGHAHVVGPGGIVRRPKTQLEPDILVYPARFKPTVKWDEITEHWLAVEVLSRSSRVYDREFKRDAYFALGVREVWLVDWRDAHVEVCKRPGPGRRARDVLRWRAPSVNVMLSIDLSTVFADLNDEVDDDE